MLFLRAFAPRYEVALRNAFVFEVALRGPVAGRTASRGLHIPRAHFEMQPCPAVTAAKCNFEDKCVPKCNLGTSTPRPCLWQDARGGRQDACAPLRIHAPMLFLRAFYPTLSGFWGCRRAPNRRWFLGPRLQRAPQRTLRNEKARLHQNCDSLRPRVPCAPKKMLDRVLAYRAGMQIHHRRRRIQAV